MKKAEDPDLDSLENNSQSKQRPSNVKVTKDDNSSVASSLTNDYLLSQETSYSNLSLGSQSTNTSLVTVNSDLNSSSSVTAKSNKYAMTPQIIEKIGFAAIKEGLTPKEIEQRIQAYQELKINEAKSNALIAIANFTDKHCPTSDHDKDNTTNPGNQESKPALKQLPSPVQLFQDQPPKVPVPLTASSPPKISPPPPKPAAIPTTPSTTQGTSPPPNVSYKEMLQRSGKQNNKEIEMKKDSDTVTQTRRSQRLTETKPTSPSNVNTGKEK